MASFRMSPTSGVLPETRITSPIMLHLFMINDRPRHSRKYVLLVESPWLLHLHVILRHFTGQGDIFAKLRKFLTTALQSNCRCPSSAVSFQSKTIFRRNSRKSWNLRISFSSSLTYKFERKFFSRISSVVYIAIFVAQSIRDGFNNYSHDEYRWGVAMESCFGNFYDSRANSCWRSICIYKWHFLTLSCDIIIGIYFGSNNVGIRCHIVRLRLSIFFLSLLSGF